MKCSGDSEILHGFVHDTTRNSSCFSDFRVVSRTNSCSYAESPLYFISFRRVTVPKKFESRHKNQACGGWSRCIRDMSGFCAQILVTKMPDIYTVPLHPIQLSWARVFYVKIQINIAGFFNELNFSINRYYEGFHAHTLGILSTKFQFFCLEPRTSKLAVCALLMSYSKHYHLVLPFPRLLYFTSTCTSITISSKK